jgi:hypothetical protein
MPNWCENELVISGPEKDVYAFFGHALGKDEDGEPLVLDFNKFAPQPGTITRDLIQDPYLRSQADERPDDELWYYWRRDQVSAPTYSGVMRVTTPLSGPAEPG